MLRKLSFIPSLTAALGGLATRVLVGCSCILAGCSGGSGGSTAPNASCSTGSFCVATCNLGCSSDGGCAISDIAQNQPLVFVFSKEVDPRTVDGTTFSLKTTSGEEPVGDFVVRGARVEFVPEVRTVQGATFYGFAANETYILSIIGGDAAPSALMSTSGDRLLADYTCNLRVTRGVVDLDQNPPSAIVITPSATTNVPRGTNVVLEFSELIDGGAFFGVSGVEAPIVFRARRTFTSPQGVVTCDPNSRAVVLGGSARLENDTIRGVTRVSYTPPGPLPADSCFEVEVTPRVRDLAGTRSSGQVFRFVVESASVVERPMTYTFDTDLELDTARSGGAWTNDQAVFAELGGDGRHGDFDPRDGTRVTDTHFIWDTDSQLISRKVSGFLNQEVTVTDGHFYFSNFVLPEGFKVEFRGSHPARIFVRGECSILGQLLASGGDVDGNHNGVVSVLPGPGQPGGMGGPGGGAGGDGAFACDGTGVPNQPQFNNFNGYDGEDMRVPAAHALAGQEVGTGGHGASLFPAHGNQANLVYRGFGGIYGVEMCAGAGGGGFVVDGQTGTVPQAGAFQGVSPYPNTNPAERGPPSPGGSSFPMLPLPGSFVSSEYLLVGGSGGGGGGSNPVFSQSNTGNPIKFRSGGGGGGGGGALLLRSGAEFAIASTGVVASRGGSCEPTSTAFSHSTRGVPGPGGGGSGGTILLQTSGALRQSGELDVRGGIGSKVEFLQFFALKALGGDGSPGFLRVERPGSGVTIAELGTARPPATAQNVGVLAETDIRAGFQSLWRDTEETFPPIFVRYEIDALVDGVATRFSDDPAVGTPAFEGLAPIIFYVQGCEIEPTTLEPKPNTAPGPWRRYVGGFGGSIGESGVNSDAPTGIRWTLVIDRSLGVDVVIDEVRVYYRS